MSTRNRFISTPTAKTDLAEDVIWGIDGENGIAAVLGIPVQRAYYLIAQGKLPVRRLGHRTVVASRAQLRAYLAGELASE